MTRLCGTIFGLVLAATSAAAQEQALPPAARGVDVEEKLDAALPLDTELIDEMGEKLTLRQVIGDGRPAVLQLGYFGCPMLCDQVSQGLLRSMKQLDLNAGSDFNVIYISFDPRETHINANQKKLGYVKQYDRAGGSSGWRFLVGGEQSVKSIADAVGFRYRWDEASQQFSHAAVLIILTPDGRVSRYLYGVEFPKQTLQLSLVEASAGKIGSTADRVMMLCFTYNPETGRYTLAATYLMQIAAGVTVVILGAWIGRMLLKERRQRLSAT
jgi:protein SCO1/2